jgi:cysteine synthase B
MGTTGTIMGTSTYLKEKNPAIQIIGANQRVVRKSSVNGQKNICLKSLMLQGRSHCRSKRRARAMTKRLALEEGILQE